MSELGRWLRRLIFRAQRALVLRHAQREFADRLHASNAWHCGCWACVAASRGPGKVVKRGRFMGIPTDTVKLNE